MSTVKIKPPWPGRPYPLVCPDSRANCSLLGSHVCAEPELETFEVVSSLLLHCDESCVYVDLGCNIGAFAAYAASFGARVVCVEPQSTYAASLSATAQLYPNFTVIHAAAAAETVPAGSLFTSRDGFKPCGVGRPLPEVQVPFVAIGDLARGAEHISLLKIDVDSIEGALLHTVTGMLEAKQARIDSILVELGDFYAPFARRMRHPQPGAALTRHHRGGDVHDIWRLQQLGYHVLRLNIHTGQQLYDWKGADVNQNPAVDVAASMWTPVYFLRAMRKVELLRRHNSSEGYEKLLAWGQSLLITRLTLFEKTTRNPIDLNGAHHRYQNVLNRDFPLPGEGVEAGGDGGRERTRAGEPPGRNRAGSGLRARLRGPH